MSDAHDPRDHGGHNDPEFRLGRPRRARRRIAALLIGVVVTIFAVLLTIWLVGRSAADAQTAGAAGDVSPAPWPPGSVVSVVPGISGPAPSRG